jgi:hypothetical protein
MVTFFSFVNNEETIFILFLLKSDFRLIDMFNIKTKLADLY